MGMYFPGAAGFGCGLHLGAEGRLYSGRPDGSRAAGEGHAALPSPLAGGAALGAPARTVGPGPLGWHRSALVLRAYQSWASCTLHDELQKHRKYFQRPVQGTVPAGADGDEGNSGWGRHASCAYEMCLDPPNEHPCADQCRALLAASAIGSTHWLTRSTSQVGPVLITRLCAVTYQITRLSLRRFLRRSMCWQRLLSALRNPKTWTAWGLPGCSNSSAPLHCRALRPHRLLRPVSTAHSSLLGRTPVHPCMVLAHKHPSVQRPDLALVGRCECSWRLRSQPRGADSSAGQGAAGVHECAARQQAAHEDGPADARIPAAGCKVGCYQYHRKFSTLCPLPYDVGMHGHSGCLGCTAPKGCCCLSCLLSVQG